MAFTENTFNHSTYHFDYVSGICCQRNRNVTMEKRSKLLEGFQRNSLLLLLDLRLILPLLQKLITFGEQHSLESSSMWKLHKRYKVYLIFKLKSESTEIRLHLKALRQFKQNNICSAERIHSIYIKSRVRKWKRFISTLFFVSLLIFFLVSHFEYYMSVI